MLSPTDVQIVIKGLLDGTIVTRTESLLQYPHPLSYEVLKYSAVVDHVTLSCEATPDRGLSDDIHIMTSFVIGGRDSSLLLGARDRLKRKKNCHPWGVSPPYGAAAATYFSHPLEVGAVCAHVFVFSLFPGTSILHLPRVPLAHLSSRRRQQDHRVPSVLIVRG